MSSPFRKHWQIDPEIAFLNHGSFGACPTPVLELQAELRERMERELVQFLARELEGRIDAAREELARFLGARPENLAFVSNATSGVNAVLRSMELDAGDEILVTDHNYNACRNAAEFVTDRCGARTVLVHVPFPIASPDEVVEAILAGVTPRTRLALLDHVTSETGAIFPIPELVSRLRERGVETLIDGAHAPGMLELSLEDLGAAYYTGNCHKWICAPKGAAFLWVRPDLQAGVRPPVISHGANSRRTDRSRFLQEFDWTGTQDPTAWLCVPEAIRFMGGLVAGGWPGLRAHNRALLLAGRDRVLATLGTEAPVPDDMLGSLASLLLPVGDGPAAPPSSAFELDPLHRGLFEDHRIEVPVMWSAAAGRRILRLSAQAYNDADDYERLARALA